MRAAEKERFGRLRRRINEDRTGSREDARQFGAKFFSQFVIEIGEWFVEQDEIRTFHKRARNSCALLLTAGELQRGALQERFKFQQ